MKAKVLEPRKVVMGALGEAGPSQSKGSDVQLQGGLWVPCEPGSLRTPAGMADMACSGESGPSSMCVRVPAHTCFTKESQTPECARPRPRGGEHRQVR